MNIARGWWIGIAAAGLAVGPGLAGAQQTWAPNGVTPGGNGTWNASNTNWLPGPAAWSAGQTGVFAGTSGTITVPTSINVASGLRFEADGFRVTNSQAGDPASNFVFSNALNLQGATTVEVVPGAVATVATLLTGAGGFTKTGAGGFNLVNPFSTFSGNVTVNAGTVFAGGNGVPIGAGAGIYGFHNGNNSALGTISGAAAATRQIVVNSSGTLSFIGDDTFGDRDAAVTPVTIVANGGMVINGPSVPNNGTPVNTGFQGALTLLGPVQLNGATMRSTWGKFTPNQDGPNPQGYPGFQAFAFRSSVTSSGLSTIDSQLDRVPRFGGFHLGGAIADPNPTFAVDSGTLAVSAVLLDKPSSMDSEAGGSRNNIRSGFVKAGAGTMILSGTNEYTGDTSLTAGTLTLAGSGVLRFANTGTGGTGLFNSIGGSAGTLNLDGTLFFDLAGASTTPGTTWNIVNGASIDEFYGNTFAVTSSAGAFAGNAGVWTLVDGPNTWTFEQMGGTLSVIPEPSLTAAGAAGLALAALLRRQRSRSG